jgi:hypothetical protein
MSDAQEDVIQPEEVSNQLTCRLRVPDDSPSPCVCITKYFIGMLTIHCPRILRSRILKTRYCKEGAQSFPLYSKTAGLRMGLH